MRKIKFRGKKPGGKKFFYGWFVPDVPISSRPGIIDKAGMYHKVDFNTLAQFVGYDKNGEEIYSDDTVVEEIFPGAVPQNYIAGDRIPVNRIGEKFFNYELLKEKK